VDHKTVKHMRRRASGEIPLSSYTFLRDLTCEASYP
jgi:hypothetical protein